MWNQHLLFYSTEVWSITITEFLNLIEFGDNDDKDDNDDDDDDDDDDNDDNDDF